MHLPPSSPIHQGGTSPSRREIQGSTLQNQPKAQKRAQHHFAFSIGAHGQGLRSCALAHHQNLGTDVCFMTDFYCFCVSLHFTLQVIPCVPLGKSLLCLCPSGNDVPCTGMGRGTPKGSQLLPLRETPLPLAHPRGSLCLLLEPGEPTVSAQCKLVI